MNFEEFLEYFDNHKKIYICWLINQNAFPNKLGFKVNNENKYKIIISWLKLICAFCHIYFIIFLCFNLVELSKNPNIKSKKLVLIIFILYPG